MKKFLIYFVCLIFIMSASLVFAEIKSLIKEYTYQASEHKIEPSPIFSLAEMAAAF